MAELVELATRVVPRAARAALKEVVDRGPLGESGRESVAVLHAMLWELELAKGWLDGQEEADCPHCGGELLSPLRVNEHMAVCPRHPAVARLSAVREALRLAPALADALALRPVPVDPELPEMIERALVLPPPSHRGLGGFYSSVDSARESLFALLRSGSAEPGNPDHDDAKALAEAVGQWERLLHRETDPCRLCGEVTALDQALDHVHTCTGHPAARVGAAGEMHLKRLFGAEGGPALVALALERDRQLAGLEALIKACRGLDTELWRDPDRCTVRPADHAALRRAVSAAMQVTWLRDRRALDYPALADRAAEAPPFARPAWRALLRVGRNGETPGSHSGTSEDATLLRQVAQEALRLERARIEEINCPACGRSGLWGGEAAAHIANCPCLPARLRESEVEARLDFAITVLDEKRPSKGLRLLRPVLRTAPLDRMTPVAWCDETETLDVGLGPSQSGAAGLTTLLEPAVRRRRWFEVEDAVTGMARLLTDWASYRTVAECECPFCDHPVRPPALFAHLTACQAHPAVDRAEAMEASLAKIGAERLEGIGRLRREAALARHALARLAEYMDSFARTFSYNQEIRRCCTSLKPLPMWEGERKRAQATLEKLRGDEGPEVAEAPTIETLAEP